MKINSLILIVSFIFSASLFCQEREYQFFKNIKTKTREPFKLRDPFKRKMFKRKIKGKKEAVFLKDGSFSNLPDISDIPLSKLRVIGILLGTTRSALLKAEKGAQIYTVKEGMMIGVDNAEVKAILPGGIVVVEKITNVYDQDEYVETIIPVSQE